MFGIKLIVCLPTFFLPGDKNSTGGTISNFHLINELAKFGNVDVISPIVSPELIDRKIPNVNLVTAKGLDGDSFNVKAKKKIWLKKQIRARTLIDDFDLIISTNGTTGFVENIDRSRNIILTRAYEDFYDYPINGESLKEKIRKKVLSLFIGGKIKQSYQCASQIITNSQFMRREISENFGINMDKIVVLYPPIDFPEANYRPLPSDRKLRIGMINPKKIKGEEIFIQLAKYFKNIEFVYFSRENKNYDGNNIIYEGWESDPAKLFNSFDILIAPSFWNEPFGRVAVEGIRSGILVLVSNHGGIPETVNDCFVVKGDTLTDWKEKLIWLLENPDEVAEGWQKTKQHTDSFISEQHTINLKKFIINYFGIDERSRTRN